MKFRILLLALASTGLASAARYTNYSSTQFTQGTVLDFSVAKFNSNLGTLTGVTVTVTSGNLQGSPTVTNPTAGTVGINAITDTFYVTTPSASGGYSSVLGYYSASLITNPVLTTPTRVSVTIPAGETQVLTIDAGQSTTLTSRDRIQDIGSGFFSAYQAAGGTGSVTFQAQNIFSITTTGASYTVNSSDVGNNTQFAITYTYSAIPETSSALLGGLGTLVLLRRRRL